jgi:hypothetical protein
MYLNLSYLQYRKGTPKKEKRKNQAAQAALAAAVPL